MSRPIDFRSTAGTPSGQSAMAPTDDDIVLRVAVWLADVSTEARFASTTAGAARPAAVASRPTRKLASMRPIRR